MTSLTRRDRLGAQRVFFDPLSGLRAADLRSLLAQAPSLRRSGLDPLGIAHAWGLTDAPEHTCLRGVRALPPAERTVRAARPAERTVVRWAANEPRSGLGITLVEAMRAELAVARRPVVALGGGIDAPLAVLAARRAGLEVREAIHVGVPGSSYDESEAARETAAALGLSLHQVCLGPEDLAAALSEAVRLAETPLYNLHPVSRAVVARVALARGHDVLLTGDGADQASRGATERADYVPVVAAITRGAGLRLASPFVDEAVVDRLIAAHDPEKNGLRALAVEWGLPAALAERAKVASSAPPLAQAFFPESDVLSRLSFALDRELAWSDDDRTNVGIASLAAFVAAFDLELSSSERHERGVA